MPRWVLPLPVPPANTILRLLSDEAAGGEIADQGLVAFELTLHAPGRFFVRLEARFSVPTRTISTAARAGAVKDARLRARQGLSLTAPSTPPGWDASGADLLSIGELYRRP